MENSNIEWTDHTFNPWIGCTKVDELCAHCYAEARDIRFNGGQHWGKGAPRQRTTPSNWNEPRRWNREADKAYEEWKATLTMNPPPRRPRVFCASLADWLDDEVPIEWLADLLLLIYNCPNLDWLLLSKRPENFFSRLEAVSNWVLKFGGVGDNADSSVRFYIWLEAWRSAVGFPSNVWIGTSVGTQKSADLRIPELLKIPARIRFLSCEPLLGPVEFSNVTKRVDCVKVLGNMAFDGIHWLIAGGESGKGARPMHPDWARRMRDQCRAAGVPFFFKQWGEWAPAEERGDTVSVTLAQPGGGPNPEWHEFGHTEFKPRQLMARVGKKAAGALLDGREHKEFPA